jgi:SHS2 domain-containing protein
MPYEEIPHTADLALRVWARDLPTLYADAARGMLALLAAEPAPGETQTRLVEVRGEDAESLLVSWLQELLYLTETERLIFTEFHVLAVKPPVLQAEVCGRPLGRLGKWIKAVTYHNLKIKSTAEGHEVTIVLDV